MCAPDLSVTVHAVETMLDVGMKTRQPFCSQLGSPSSVSIPQIICYMLELPLIRAHYVSLITRYPVLTTSR